MKKIDFKNYEGIRLPFSVDEIALIMSKSTGWIKDFFVTGIYTAMRLGDIANLRWSEVDLDDGWITKDSGKNKKNIDMPILSELKQYLSQKKSNGDYVYPELRSIYAVDNGITIRRVFADFLDEIGIEGVRAQPAGCDQKKYRKGCHNTRYTIPFLLSSLNPPVPNEDIEELLGSYYIKRLNRADKKRIMSQLHFGGEIKIEVTSDANNY